MTIPSIAAIPSQSLEEALDLVAQRFDVASILDRSYRLADVAEYYHQSDRGYRLFHSRDGALHIALRGDGHSDTQCFARQAELFVEQMDATHAARVVEFGCGMGYNIRQIAQRRPDWDVWGVDLTESHIQAGVKACQGVTNARFECGDYESLPHQDGLFDGVLAVETLCQTSSQEAAVAEASRLLCPGGRLVVIDCFRRAPLETRNPTLEAMDPALKQAAQLVEKTTAVDAFRVTNQWIAMADAAGLRLVQEIDLSAETEKNLARLHSLARRFFGMPLTAGAMATAFAPRLLENAVCGLLMPYTVGFGAHAYCMIVVEKS